MNFPDIFSITHLPSLMKTVKTEFDALVKRIENLEAKVGTESDTVASEIEAEAGKIDDEVTGHGG